MSGEDDDSRDGYYNSAFPNPDEHDDDDDDDENIPWSIVGDEHAAQSSMGSSNDVTAHRTHSQLGINKRNLDSGKHSNISMMIEKIFARGEPTIDLQRSTGR
jgi:hypothetical protein